MRVLRYLTCFLLAVPALADTVVFRNITVIPMTSPNAMEKQTVVIKDGVIASISKKPVIPKDAKVVDGTGKFLIPGLADMHVHVPAVEAKGELMLDVLTMLVANGVTTARGMWGFPGQLDVRTKARLGQIVSPRLFLAGVPFSSLNIGSAQEVVDRVRLQKQEGWDLLKVHDGLTLEQYDALANTARAVKMRFAGHVPQAVSLPHAIESGQESIEHLDPFLVYLETAKGPVDEKKLAALASQLEEAGTWVTPTLAASEITWGATSLETLKDYPENKYSPNLAVDSWVKSYDERVKRIPRGPATNVVSNNRRIIKALNDTGVRLLLGTDALQQFIEPGFSVLREMESLRGAGLTPYQILRTATVNPAIYLGEEASSGTIEKGKRADLVVLDANPLTDVTNIAKVRGVMAGGRWYTREQLDEALKRIHEKYH
ncbi:MAG TPA: amidohydrolase family protein [Thermoanaerobaculia bacterium]|nr:amidohydrolase family protein [Thermoanaerobaculia bacterium]